MNKPFYEDRKRQLLWLAVHKPGDLSTIYDRTRKDREQPQPVFAPIHEMIRAVLAREFPTSK